MRRLWICAYALLVLAPASWSSDVTIGGYPADADRVLIVPDQVRPTAHWNAAAEAGFSPMRIFSLAGTRRTVSPTQKIAPVDLGSEVAYVEWRRPSLLSLEQALALAETLPGVESAWPDYRHEPAYTPNDPYYADYQTNFPQIGVPDAWKLAFGKGVIVAVIDSGYRSGLDDAAELVSPYDFWGGDENVQDFIGHGTHVANVIGEATDNGIGCAGMAPKAKIMPLKVFPDGDGGAYDTDIANAIDWARNEGAHVINMSLGGGGWSGVTNSAVRRAVDANMLVFAASGNDGKGSLDYPAGYPDVIAVGSSQPRNGNNPPFRSSFSNYGNGLDLVAPGENIVQQTIGGSGIGYYGAYGTSVASPHAAGAAALLIDVVGPGSYDADEIAQALYDTARSPESDWLEDIGWGEINLKEAMEALGEIVPNAPPDAVISVDKAAGNAPLTVKFSGLASSDPDGNIDNYSWSLPDLGLKQGPSIEYTFTEKGDYQITLTVTDVQGDSDSATITVSVSASKSSGGDDDDGACGGCSTARASASGSHAGLDFGWIALAALALMRWTQPRR